MPADNVKGSGRIPSRSCASSTPAFGGSGGNFLSGWSWYDSVGDIDKRPPMFDHAWNAMQTNDVGMDEFMTLCKLIGVEPYISVNAGFGDAHSAAEEVEYINGSANTRLGASARGTAIPSRIMSSSGISATSLGVRCNSATPT